VEQYNSSLCKFIFKISRSHTLLDTHTHTKPVGLLWTSDQPVAETATLKTHKKNKRRTSMPSVGLFLLSKSKLQTFHFCYTASTSLYRRHSPTLGCKPGTRTGDPRDQAAANLRLRPCGHRDRPVQVGTSI
jgi:hypothetical protein